MALGYPGPSEPRLGRASLLSGEILGRGQELECSARPRFSPTEMLRAILAMELVVGLWYEWGRDRPAISWARSAGTLGFHLL